MSAVAHIDEYKTGRFYSDDYRGEMSWNGYEYSNLLRNEGCREDGTPYFSDVAMAVGADDRKDARGLAIADLDNDGDLDLAINHNIGDHGDGSAAESVVLRNDLGQARHWLAVELEGRTSNRDAVGATVRIDVGDQTQLQLVSAGSSYASQHTQRLHFGLDQAETVDRLTVRWPAGGTQEWLDLGINQILHLVEGQEEVTRLPRPSGFLGSDQDAPTPPTFPVEPSSDALR